VLNQDVRNILKEDNHLGSETKNKLKMLNQKCFINFVEDANEKIENGFQVEYPDDWTKYGDPWSIKRMDRVFEVKFGGQIEVHRDEFGKEYFKRVNTETVHAVAYDVPVIGYGNDTVNTLRLWEARSPEGFDLKLFNDQTYLQASAKAVQAEDISRVLYPNDTEKDGKLLRLKQQFNLKLLQM